MIRSSYLAEGASNQANTKGHSMDLWAGQIKNLQFLIPNTQHNILIQVRDPAGQWTDSDSAQIIISHSSYWKLLPPKTTSTSSTQSTQHRSTRKYGRCPHHPHVSSVTQATIPTLAPPTPPPPSPSALSRSLPPVLTCTEVQDCS